MADIVFPHVEDDNSETHDSDESFWWGQTLNWNAPKTPATLWVELPYWLMVINCSLQVTARGAEFPVDIRDSYEELHADATTYSRRTCIYIGPHPPHLRADLVEELEKEEVSILPRLCRTVFRIHSQVNEDVLRAAYDAGRRSREALSYLQALCEAHLEVVNTVVTAYRLGTYDYFPYEVGPWDVPIWFVEVPTGFVRVPLLPYADWDEKPRFSAGDAKPCPLMMISPTDLQESLGKTPSPGEMELLDSLVLIGRGDYGGAVRRVTTAIEVILEHVLRQELLQRYSNAETERRLYNSRNDFPGRLRQYERLSGRQLSASVATELERTRDLRHDIIHRGLRIGFDERGVAQRSVDTGRWIFNWLEQVPDRVKLRETYLATRSVGRHMALFQGQITAAGADVVPPTLPSET